MQHLAFLGAGALALLASPTLADTLSPGYELTPGTTPVGFSTWGVVSATLPSGELVTFDGQSVDLWTPAGLLVMNLAALPTPHFAAWILPTPDGLSVVFGHSGDFTGGGDVYTAALDGSGLTYVAGVIGSYDAAFLSGGDLIVTADTSGLGNGNDFVRIELSTQSWSVIGHVDGPSGPVAVRANGDLYYATATYTFPAAPGSTDIVRWTAAQLAGGTFLDDTNWTVWGAGYDPVASMAVDPAKNRIFVAENLYDGSFALLSARIRRARPNASQAEDVAVCDLQVGGLEFVSAGGGSANFQAYQPGDGSNLLYSTTDFFSTATLDRIAPKRPTLTASGPGTLGVGAVYLDVVDGPPDGTLFLLFCPQGSLSPTEQTYLHPGYLFHTRLAPGTTRRMGFYLSTDAGGAGGFSFWNPGGLSGAYGYQFLVGDMYGSFVGSSNDVSF